MSRFSALSASFDTLANRYQSGSAPQALMLSGPFGVGKRTLAKLLCLYLFCQQDGAIPCGECKACCRVIAESHPNLLVIRLASGEKSIKIEQVRDMLAQLKLYPLEQGRRAVILEGFDLFTVPAQNALLKAIEEPDSSTLYILTAVNEKAVLPTILSRCLLQRMPAWPDELMADVLSQGDLDEETVSRLIPLSSGSPGMVLRLHQDDDFWQLKDKADRAFDALSNTPEASDHLKDLKADAGQVLDYLETKAHADFMQNVKSAEGDLSFDEAAQKHRQTLEALFHARRQRASNLSWQAMTDQLLLTLSEE